MLPEMMPTAQIAIDLDEIADPMGAVIEAILRVEVEPGWSHPAESLLAAMLFKNPGSRDLGAEDVSRGLHPSCAAGFLRLLGRVPPGSETLINATERGLMSEDLAVREAAIDALEEVLDEQRSAASGAVEISDLGRRIVEILRDHAEREPVGWLADYARRIAG